MSKVLNWGSAFGSVATGTANIISATKSGGGGSGQSVNNTIVHERQLTPEEIAIMQAEAKAREDQRVYDNAFKAMVYNDTVRANDPRYQKPKEDNTALYIVGGLLAVAVLFKIINQNKK